VKSSSRPVTYLSSPFSLRYNPYIPMGYSGEGVIPFMSILVRDRNGKGCVELPPEERHGSVPVTVRDKAGRPPDLDLFTRALEDEWDDPPQVKADVVSR